MSMEDISLHILDIVENSIIAGAKNISIKINEDKKKDLLEIEIKDDGKGMDEKLMRKAIDPFVTTKAGKKTGFGLALLEEAAKSAGGSFSVKSKKGVGTVIRSSFQYNHWDRKPMGNIKETLLCLIVSNPDVHFAYKYTKGKKIHKVDTEILRKEAGETSRNLPQWIKFLKENIDPGFKSKNFHANR